MADMGRRQKRAEGQIEGVMGQGILEGYHISRRLLTPYVNMRLCVYSTIWGGLYVHPSMWCSWCWRVLSSLNCAPCHCYHVPADTCPRYTLTVYPTWQMSPLIH